jgi:hypothetical protein
MSPKYRKRRYLFIFMLCDLEVIFMKKKLFIFGVIATIVIGIYMFYNSYITPLGIFERTFKLRLPNKTICKKQYDDHGGFHGDGTSLYCLYLPEGAINNLLNNSKMKSWNQLPLPNKLESISYHGFGKEAGLPRVQNGYWKFVGDTSLENMIHSYDFYLAIFDTDKNVIYVLKVNT